MTKPTEFIDVLGIRKTDYGWKLRVDVNITPELLKALENYDGQGPTEQYIGKDVLFLINECRGEFV